MVHRLHSVIHGVGLKLFHSRTNCLSCDLVNYFHIKCTDSKQQFQWVQIGQKCKAKKHITVQREVNRLSLVVEKNKYFFQSKGRQRKHGGFHPQLHTLETSTSHCSAICVALSCCTKKSHRACPCLSP